MTPSFAANSYWRKQQKQLPKYLGTNNVNIMPVLGSERARGRAQQKQEP
jgi:hypothetical protein